MKKISLGVILIVLAYGGYSMYRYGGIFLPVVGNAKKATVQKIYKYNFQSERMGGTIAISECPTDGTIYFSAGPTGGADMGASVYDMQGNTVGSYQGFTGI
jgi:hypothetical protein